MVNGRYTLHDLINLQQLKETFLHFAEVTGLSATLLSYPEGTLLVGNGRWNICSQFHHTTPEANSHCQQKPPRAENGPQTAPAIQILECPCGLSSAAAPIRADGRQIATLFSGQCLRNSPDPAQDRPGSAALGGDPESYRAASRTAPILSESQLANSFKLLQQIVTMMVEQGLAQENGRLAVQQAIESQARLQENLNRFNLLAKQSGTIIWEITTDGLYKAVSPSVVAILGYQPEELVGKLCFYDLFPEALRQEYKETAFATIAQQQTFHGFENPLQTKSGKIIWVSSDGIPLFDASGNLSGYWGTDMDITPQKRGEIALRESERRYRLLAENVTDVIWTMDLNLNSTYTSPSVLRLRGYDSATAMSQSLAETLTPESLAIVSQALAEELAQEQQPDKDPERSRVLQLETRRQDGSIVPTETTVTFLRDAAGRPVEILGVTRDTSERKQMEEATQKSKERAERQRSALLQVASDPTITAGDLLAAARKLMEKAADALDIDRASVWLLAGQEQALQCVALYEADSQTHSAGMLLNSQDYPAYWHALHTEGRINAQNAQTDPRIRELRDDYLRPLGITSLLDAPIRFGEALVGVVCFEHIGPERVWQDDEQLFINAVTGLVAQTLINERRKQAEEQLRKSEANLKAILENSLESIWSIDTDYKILYINEVFATAFHHNFGVELQSGLNILEFLPIHLHATWKARYELVFQNEHFVFQDEIDLGVNRVYIEVAAHPILLDGQVVGASFYGRDITQQILANQQIRYETALRKLLIDLSTNFINLPLEDLELAIERSLVRLGEFVGVDRAYLFEYDFVAHRAINTYEWCAVGITPEIDNLQNVPLSFVPDWLEAHQRGEPFWVPDVQALPDKGPDCLRGILEPQGIKSLIALPMVNNGRLLGFVGFDSVRQYHDYADYERQLLQLYAQMLVNVMERLQTEQRMRQAQEDLSRLQKLESLGTLAGGIAHDFNNLLMGLFGNMTLARRYLDIDHPAAIALMRAEQAMERATRLTHQLLTFAKGGDPIREVSDIGLLVKETIYFDLAGSNVQPRITYPADLWPADVDKGQIQQAISNLAINAMQAMPLGGNVFISLRNVELTEGDIAQLPAGQYIQIVARDEGSGIDPKHIKRIFDPYFTTKQTGSGLGLATAHSIVRKHGGHISVASLLGQGTTFTLYLPATSARPDTLGNFRGRESSPPSEVFKILLLDDDEILRSGVADLLDHEGYVVETAADGREAISLYQRRFKEKRPFSAVIMDLTIPGGLGGREAIQDILALDPQACCIVSSGYADDPVMANYATYGFKAAIKKPYNLRRLIEVIEQVIRV